MSLRLRFAVVRRVFAVQYPILALFSLLQIPKMVVFPIDKERLVRGRVVSEWGFFRLTRCPLPPSAIRARFGCWGLFIGLRPFPFLLAGTFHHFTPWRDCGRETGNPLVADTACGAGLSGLSRRSFSEDGSAASANNMIILVRLGFEQLC